MYCIPATMHSSLLLVSESGTFIVTPVLPMYLEPLIRGLYQAMKAYIFTSLTG